MWIKTYFFILMFMYINRTLSSTDLVFTMNTPASQSNTELSHLVDFMYSVVDLLPFATNDTRVSIVSYAESAVLQFNFTAYNTKTDILNAIINLKTISTNDSSSKPHEALEYVRLSVLVNARSDSQKVIVHVSVQDFDDGFLSVWSALDLRTDFSATIIVVAVNDTSSTNQNNLKLVAGDESRYFYIEDYSDMCTIVTNISLIIDSTVQTNLTFCIDPTTVTPEATLLSEGSLDDILVITGALSGVILMAATVIISYRCVQISNEKFQDLRVRKAIEVYGDARLGCSKESFQTVNQEHLSSVSIECETSVTLNYKTKIAIVQHFTNGRLFSFKNSGNEIRYDYDIVR